ncbi:cytochrome P450 [Serendipita vermifera]|nr:cytochrome P450 [Serendipita vermifera]
MSFTTDGFRFSEIGPAEKIGATACAAVLATYFVLKFLPSRQTHPLPPGPPREPFIGCLRSFPKDHFYERFCEWAQRYGNIVYITLPGLQFAVVNSYDVAYELLSKRPNTTSGRTTGYMVHDLMGWGWCAFFMQPDSHHLKQRKMMRRGIGPQGIGAHNSLFETEVTKLALDLQNFHGNPMDRIVKMFGGIVTKMVYGEGMWNEMGEELSNWNIEGMKMIAEANASLWIVDSFPFLRYIPEWTPGVRFKELARESTVITNKIRHIPFERAKELYREGALGNCILNDLMDEYGFDDDVRDATSMLYTGGASTSTGVAMSFIHAMFLFPEIAKKVYEEIESVTQGQRLPLISDRAKLPFTEATWKEANRWRPAVPIGIPHTLLQDEIIDGYFVPKGTSIQPNNGFMLTDPKIWGDPEVFRPERFLDREAAQRLPNPLVVIFGYGLRACPGMHMADRIGFHLAATILALYSISPLKDQIIPDPNTIEYTDRVIRHVIGFECRFVPRNRRIMDLVNDLSLNVS